MSLQLAAKHLESHGRGPDDTLVHMSRGEVKSLNDLAMAHGGHLTINPKTGLPEAGFLSAILPMVAGAALGPAGFGLTSALGAGLAVGAGSMLLNPKAGLMGGLMAGLGAYGGSNLGEALAMEGMGSTVTPPVEPTVPPPNVPPTGESVALQNAGVTTNPIYPRVAYPLEAWKNGMPLESMSPEARQMVIDNSGTTFNGESANAGYGYKSGITGSPIQTPPTTRLPIPGTTELASNPMYSDYGPSTIDNGRIAYKGIPAQTYDVTPASPEGLKNMTVSERFDAMKKGLTSGDLTKVAGNNIGSLTAVASPLLTQKPADVAPVVDKDRGQQYSYSPGVAKPLPAASVPTYEDMLTKQGNFGRQQNYYPNQGYTPISNDQAKEMYHYAADGGLMGYAGGGPVEQMSNQDALGANTMYPMANMATSAFATPYQSPQPTSMLAPAGGNTVNMMSGEPNMQGTRLAEGGEATPGYTYDPQTQKYISSAPTVPMMPTGAGAGISSAMGMTYDPATQRFTGGSGGGIPSDQIYLGGGQYGLNEAGRKAAEEAAARSAGYGEGPGGSGDGGSTGEARGGLSPNFPHNMATGGLSDAQYNLGGYSDGGRLLRGPGDGVSDSIPAMIGKKQPARLADGEFVVPARIVSELGNGSTEAGARKLYAMMDRIQSARKQTVGKGKVAHNSRATKYLPA